MSYFCKVTGTDGTTGLIGSSLFGTCATEAATVAKVGTCSDFDTLITGVTIHIKFTNSNTASNPTLNVNNTGAKRIYKNGTTSPGTTAATSWKAGEVVSLTYDGSAWQMNDTYTHPAYTSASSGLYKITVDSTGHVSATTAVAKADIPSLDYSKVSITRNLTSGTKVGTITIDGTPTDLYCQTNTNTDTLVSQTFATADHNRPLLMSYYDTGVETTTAQVVHRNDTLYFNPNSGILRSPRLYLQTTGMPITINLDTLKPTAGENVNVLSVRYKNTDGTATHTVCPIGIFGNDATGSSATVNSGVRLGSTNGTTIVGAGESSTTLAAAQAKYNDENLYFVADGAVYMYTSCSNDSTTVTGPWRVGGFTTGTSAITSGRVMITDGTTGGFKASDYTIAKSVPSDAKFSDTTYSAGTGLSLSGTTINHSNSVTAKTDYNKKFFTHDAQGHITETNWYIHKASGTNGSNNDTTWIKIATLVHTSTYNNAPITITFTQRGNTTRNRLTIRFSSVNSNDPSLALFLLTCDALWALSNSRALIVKTATSTWDIYIKKLDTHELIHVSDFDIGSTGATKLTWTWKDEQVTTTPADATEATKKVYSTTDHTHSYAGSSSAGGAATNVNITNLASSAAAGTYRMTFVLDSGSQDLTSDYNNGPRYRHEPGTTTDVGVGRIMIGNNTASGATGNAKGQLALYSQNTGYAYLEYASSTANSIFQLPAKTAGTYTLATTSDLGSYLPLSGGTLTGELTFASFANATADADRHIFFKHNTANRICTNDNFKYNPAKKRLYCTVVNRTLTGGTAVAGQDKGSGVSPRYFPAQWTFNAGLTPADGDTIIIKIPGAGHASGVWLSVNNGTTYYPISNNNKTRLQTQFASGQNIELMFKSDGKTTTYPMTGANSTSDLPSSGGCWVVLNYYDSNSDTKVRQTLTSGNSNRPILLSYAETSSSTANVDNVAYRNNYIFANTATGAITAGSFLTTTGFTAPVMKRLYSNDSTSGTSITIVRTDIADYEFFVVIVTDSPGSSWESIGTHWIPARTGLHNVMFNNGAAPTATGGYNHLMDGAIQISQVGESGQDLSFLVIRPDKAVSTINSSSVSVDTPPNIRIMRVYGIKAFPNL